MSADAATEAGLLRSLDRLVAVPVEHRCDNADRLSASQLLCCGDQLLTELIHRGLPCSGPPGQELFDQRDLFNLALYSGSGRTAPERAFSYAVRWMSGPTDAMLVSRSWSVEVRLDCAEPAGCGADPSWSLAVPDPESYGGTTRRISIGPGQVAAAAGVLRAEGAFLGVSSTIDTVGRCVQIRSGVLRALLGDLLESGLRWVKLPEPMQTAVDRLIPLGVASCVTASLHLERRCRAEGLAARTRRGWALGMLDLVHAWVEVQDEDGEIKIIDPIFALFSGMVGSGNPILRDPRISVRTNRLLPTVRQAHEPLEHHCCGGQNAIFTKRTTILPADFAHAARGRSNVYDSRD